MKKLIILLLPLFLIACFDNSETYDCDGIGLKITNSKATFGFSVLNFCEKMGLVNFYGGDCRAKDAGEYSFDTVTHHFSYGTIDIKCKKIN